MITSKPALDLTEFRENFQLSKGSVRPRGNASFWKGRPLLFPLFGALKFYQVLISPALHFAAGPTCGCRFHPKCSDYATEALLQHGAIRGVFLSARRLLKCHPFHAGGVDFCPPPRAVPPRCQRISAT